MMRGQFKAHLGYLQAIGNGLFMSGGPHFAVM